MAFLFGICVVACAQRHGGYGVAGSPSCNISWWQRSPILTKSQRVSAPVGLKSTAAK